MTEAMAAALVEGGASILAGAGSAIGTSNLNYKNRQFARENRDWQELMMDKQNQWSMDMWNKQNEYDSPANQRQRLLDAGINPLSADIANVGSSSLSSASPSSSPNMPMMANPTSDMINNALSTAATIANIKNTEANTRKTEADTDYQNIINQFEVDTYGNKLKMSDLTLEGSQLNNESKKVEIAKVKNDIELSKDNFKLELQKFDLANAEFDFKVAQKDIENYFESQHLDLAQKQYALAQFNASVAAALADSNISVNNANALLINANTGKIEIGNQREAAQLEADKPLMKANSYINTGLKVVDGVLDCVNIARFVIPKKQTKSTTTTETFGADGTHTGTIITDRFGS